MQLMDVTGAFCTVVLSALLCVAPAVLPTTRDGSEGGLAPAVNASSTTPRNSSDSAAAPAGQTGGVAPVDYRLNGTLEIVANKSVNLEDEFDGEDEKDVEREDTNNDEGDQIYSENDNYLDNYDENNDEADDENDNLENEEDSACN